MSGLFPTKPDPSEGHPGLMHDGGTFVSRSAPEIKFFEATVHGGQDAVSRSGQWAPFDTGYEWFNTTENSIVSYPKVTELDSYAGV